MYGETLSAHVITPSQRDLLRNPQKRSIFASKALYLFLLVAISFSQDSHCAVKFKILKGRTKLTRICSIVKPPRHVTKV